MRGGNRLALCGWNRQRTAGVAFRPNDIQVELRGTVALATLPNATLIGLPKEETAVEGAAEALASPPAQPRRSPPSPKPTIPPVGEAVVPASVPADAAEPVPAPADGASHNPQPHQKSSAQTTQFRAFCEVGQEDYV